MWWLFAKETETPEYVTYRYSTESENLDGIITHNKSTWKSVVSSPSSKDRKTPWKADLTLTRFDRWVVTEGYPDRRVVIVG